MRAKTVERGRTIGVEILEPPTSAGLCKVLLPSGEVALKHKDSLQPLDMEARLILNQVYDSKKPMEAE